MSETDRKQDVGTDTATSGAAPSKTSNAGLKPSSPLSPVSSSSPSLPSASPYLPPHSPSQLSFGHIQPRPINPAVRRTAEGGRHHQRSHSIDTKDRTSPILGLGQLQGDIAKFLSNSTNDAHPELNAVAPTPMSPGVGSDWDGDATSGTSSAHPPSKRSLVATGSASGAGPSNLGINIPSGVARPIARKASNNSDGSPEHGASPETRRLASRIGGEKGNHPGRTTSPARAYSGIVISPRLQALSAGSSGHARKLSSEALGPQRVPSPIYLPSASPPRLPTNPDPQHSWDSVWPRSSTPDQAYHSANSHRTSSPSPNAASTSPTTSHQGSSPVDLSRSPARLADRGQAAILSSSPTAGRPRARRPDELRTSSSSPSLRASVLPGKDEAGSPQSPRRTRGMETSKSEPIPTVGFSPTSSPGAAHCDVAAHGVSEGEDLDSSPHLGVPSNLSAFRASPASPRSPFLQLSSPPTLSNGQQSPNEPPLAESPPKTRSFIGMPPRSGYELSDDPDDVGSEEDGSSSGRGSVGTNDDEDLDEDEDEDDDDEFRDVDEMDDEDDGRRRNAKMASFDDGENGADSSSGLSSLSRPGLPKRPSLTRSGAVPAPPSVLDPIASAEAAARALTAGKGPEGASLLSYFRDRFDQNGDAPYLGAEAQSQQMELDPQIIDGETQVSALGLHADAGDGLDEGIGLDENGSDQGMETEQVEESLNTLERIFLFAKSDLSYHRVLVSSSLPEWIREVELNDAVEYIIPLLNGLGTDELDVCAAFAPELGRVMWFFFRNCPLAELDADESREGAGEQTDSKNASVESTDVGIATEIETARRPRISVATFTSLLCALLLNQTNLIAGATQQSLVHFFCRLDNRDPNTPKDETESLTEDENRARQERLYMDGYMTHAVGRNGQLVPHEPYQFDERAKEAIRNELLENVAFAIARLNLEHSRELPVNGHDAGDFSSNEPMPLDADSPQLDNSEGRETDSETKAMSKSSDNGSNEASNGVENTTDSPEPLKDNSGDESNAPADADMLDESQFLESWNNAGSPFAQEDSATNVSDFKADMDEEAAVGRMASVSLLAALCAEELVSRDLIDSRLLPEVLGLASDPAFFVRKEVAGALGPISKNLDHEKIVSHILPPFEKAMDDRIWHVRQAACFSLPTVLGRLEAPLRREKTVASMRTLVNDVSRNVRLAALEIIGEAIYMFHKDEMGVPEELVRFFLGEPFDGPPQQGEASISFDLSMDTNAHGASNAGNIGESKATGGSQAIEDDRESLLASFGFTKGDLSLSEGRWGSDFAMADTDPERPLVMAFNLPAVVLTLGADRWSRLRETHLELSKTHAVNVRKSLAASIHEIARIIGPEATKADLLSTAWSFFWDQELDVRTAFMENVDVFLSCLPKEDALQALCSMLELWSLRNSRDWRLRERLALHIPSIARQFLLEDEDGNLVSLMHLALADTVSAVRDAGVKSVPELYRAFAEHDQVIADGFLGMISDLGESDRYRLRVACLLCIQALIDGGIQRSSCELLLLSKLIQLGSDPIVEVRICLARAVGMMCRRDELYALPQSRSTELNALVARLSRDRSAEVREAVAGILSDEEVAKLVGAFEPPALEARRLVLGPSDGGPHRPEARDYGEDDSRHEFEGVGAGINATPLFDMDEAADLDDVDMDGDGSGSDEGFTFATTPAPSHRGGVDEDTDPFADEEDEPHHLLGVDQGQGDLDSEGELEQDEQQSPREQASWTDSQTTQSADGGDADSDKITLSSPQRVGPGLGGEAVASGSPSSGGPNGTLTHALAGGSPSDIRTKNADPFLAYVAGRRSQDLSRMKLDLSEMIGGGAAASGAPRGTNSSKSSSSSGTSGLPGSAESLRSPGSEDDEGKHSGDWSQLGRSELGEGGSRQQDGHEHEHEHEHEQVGSTNTEDDYVNVEVSESP